MLSAVFEERWGYASYFKRNSIAPPDFFGQIFPAKAGCPFAQVTDGVRLKPKKARYFLLCLDFPGLFFDADRSLWFY